MISICIPTYKRGKEFLPRALDSINSQNYKDYEIVINEDTEGQGMAWNTNFVIKQSKGDLIKILYQDDWLAEENSLQQIVDNFKANDNWLITSSNNNPHPHFNDWNQNTLGSPSCLTIRNKDPLLFKDLKFFLDLDYYQRMFKKFGNPKILDKVGVNIGLGTWQETNNLTQEELEVDYLKFMKQS